jgi:hypothetical protein
MRIREGLSPILSRISKQQANENNLPAYRVGQVYSVILNENSPNKETFDKYGGYGALGMIFFKDYNGNKETQTQTVDLEQCVVAYPMFPNQKIFPLIGELVLIFNLPSPNSQINSYSSQNYYISIVSIWNNIQHNAQSPTSTSILGKTFFEKLDVRPLQPYEGDIIYEGRSGNALRLGGTSKDVNRPNSWSSTGNENDPITIIGNGYAFSSSLQPYIEDINKDKSSIYLTSTQTIPLRIDFSSNPIVKPIDPNKYNLGGQAIISADRVVLSSRSDAVLIYGKTNTGIYSDKVTIDGKSIFIVNSPKIILGLKNDKIPTEPVLLGNKTISVIRELSESLLNFSCALESAISTPKGTPITQVNQAAVSLSQQLANILSKLESTKSENTFTS